MGSSPDRGRIPEVVIDVVDGPEAARVAGDLRAIYLAALSVPPYGLSEKEADGFEEELRSEVALPGFRCCLALDGRAIVGFAYGAPAFTGAPPDAWSEDLVSSVGEEQADRWIRGQFAFIWMAVRPENQGQGLGSRLHDALIGAVREKRAWLVAYPFDCPSVQLYRRRGWIEIGRGPLGSNGATRVVMGLEIGPAAAEARIAPA